MRPAARPISSPGAQCSGAHASPEHPLKVYAADGSELCFNRGKTYLAIVDDDEWPNFNYQ